ncbi:hypothetical protein VPH35_131540 [Triticum aestivum]
MPELERPILYHAWRGERADLSARRLPRAHHTLRHQAGEYPAGREHVPEDRRLWDGEAVGQGFQPCTDNDARHHRVPRTRVDLRAANQCQGGCVQLRHGALRTHLGTT